MNFITILIMLMPLIGILILVTQQFHFFFFFLSLEIITLCLVLFTSTASILMNSLIPAVRILILRLGACEARFGLSLLVIISRSHGTDLLKSISINKC